MTYLMAIDIPNFIQMFQPHTAATLTSLDVYLYIVKNLVSLAGTIIILIGGIIGLYRFFVVLFVPKIAERNLWTADYVRRNFARIILLGLEFIVAADVISTTATPDYYSLGILAIIVVIRTVLNFSLSREIDNLAPQEKARVQRRSVI